MDVRTQLLRQLILLTLRKLLHTTITQRPRLDLNDRSLSTYTKDCRSMKTYNPLFYNLQEFKFPKLDHFFQHRKDEFEALL